MDLGVNVVGINSINEIIEISKIAEESGFSNIWVGEGPNQRFTFSILAAIASNTNKLKIGTSIISILLHKPIHIIKSFQLLEEIYGPRFTIGLGRGGENHLRMVGKLKAKSFPLFEKYLDELKNKFNIKSPSYLGATGFKTLQTFGNRFNGVIINHISPKFVKWTIQMANLTKKLYVIGPAYYLPDKMEEELIILSSALIASEIPVNVSKALGINDVVEDIRKSYRNKKFLLKKEIRDFLIKNFALEGSINNFKKRINELSKLGIHGIIFGYPLTSNINKFREFAFKIN
jgi:hypothetical protein